MVRVGERDIRLFPKSMMICVEALRGNETRSLIKRIVRESQSMAYTVHWSRLSFPVWRVHNY